MALQIHILLMSTCILDTNKGEIRKIICQKQINNSELGGGMVAVMLLF